MPCGRHGGAVVPRASARAAPHRSTPCLASRARSALGGPAARRMETGSIGLGTLQWTGRRRAGRARLMRVSRHAVALAGDPSRRQLVARAARPRSARHLRCCPRARRFLVSFVAAADVEARALLLDRSVLAGVPSRRRRLLALRSPPAARRLLSAHRLGGAMRAAGRRKFRTAPSTLPMLARASSAAGVVPGAAALRADAGRRGGVGRSRALREGWGDVRSASADEPRLPPAVARAAVVSACALGRHGRRFDFRQHKPTPKKAVLRGASLSRRGRSEGGLVQTERARRARARSAARFDDGAAPGLYVAAPAVGPILFGRSVDPTPPPTAPGAAAAIS